jgi:hypothetical protein
VDQPGADRIHPLDLREIDALGRLVDRVQPLRQIADPGERQRAAEAQRTVVYAEVGRCGHAWRLFRRGKRATAIGSGRRPGIENVPHPARFPSIHPIVLQMIRIAGKPARHTIPDEARALQPMILAGIYDAPRIDARALPRLFSA